MSKGCDVLHSHSGIEVEMKFPKHIVLVDEEYEAMFSNPKPYVYKGKTYMKVSTREFAEKGGIFKYFRE
jgi:hypothetical protein